VLTDPLTRRSETGEMQPRTGDGHCFRTQVGEMPATARDREDVRRMSHNPEVAGSNPAPAARKCRSEARSPGRRSGLDLCGSVMAAGSGRTGRAGVEGTGRHWHRKHAPRRRRKCSRGARSPTRSGGVMYWPDKQPHADSTADGRLRVAPEREAAPSTGPTRQWPLSTSGGHLGCPATRGGGLPAPFSLRP
jgi:hypothetical protein